jgi:hypothetical protein
MVPGSHSNQKCLHCCPKRYTASASGLSCTSAYPRCSVVRILTPSPTNRAHVPLLVLQPGPTWQRNRKFRLCAEYVCYSQASPRCNTRMPDASDQCIKLRRRDLLRLTICPTKSHHQEFPRAYKISVHACPRPKNKYSNYVHTMNTSTYSRCLRISLRRASRRSN